jgi:hypothetical protein
MTFYKNTIRSVTSVDVTPKTNTVHTLEDEQSCYVEVYEVGRDSAGTSCAMFHLGRGFTKAAGVLSTVGATTSHHASNSGGAAAGWTATLTTSGTQRIIMSFVGSAGLSVIWECFAHVIKVNKSGA